MSGLSDDSFCESPVQHGPARHDRTWFPGMRRASAWVQDQTAWSRLFGPHHSLSADERSQMQEYETLDYIPSYSDMYVAHLRTRISQSSTLKWTLFFVVGAVVGILAFVMRQTIDLITHTRNGYIGHLMNADRVKDDNGVVLPPSYGLAWLFSVSSSVALVILASTPVVYYWSKAAGSGVEEVIAYLNGVQMPRVFNIRTGIVKTISATLAVSSGLPVGPEGPLIHLGAICGAGLTQGRSKTLGIQTRFLRRFRNNRDHRDFITAGAAAGISAAFGAPIGGLLFCMEEMATHWAPSLTWMIFFTSMTAFFTVALFNSAFERWKPTFDDFGWFFNEAAVLFEVKEIIYLNIMAVFPAFIIGTVGGLMGAAFTLLNTKVNLWRRRVIVPTKHRRVLEVACVAAVWASLTLLVPSMPFFTCDPIRDDWRSENGSVLVTYLCDKENHYSQLGTLTLSDNDGVIRRLFSRKTDAEFGFGPLIIFLIMYFGFACYTAGSAMSSGLLVPMIATGAVMGRLIGHWVVHVAIPATERSYRDDEQWIDPGVFALIGAGAFITGVSRLTVSITVIMVEISGELHFLLPIMLAVMIAKWVADVFSDSLYHTLLHLKNVPLLPLEPKQHLIDLERHVAMDAVANPIIVSLRPKEKVRNLVDTIHRTTHHSFPVLSEAGDFIGSILRKEIEVLLRSPETFAPDPSSSLPPPDDLPDRPMQLSFGQMSRRNSEVNWGNTDWWGTGGNFSPGMFECYIDLSPYINRSCFTVQHGFSLKLTYELFTSMGLRHLIVLDGKKCVGVITRKDMLSQNLEDRLGPGALADQYQDTSTAHPVRRSRSGVPLSAAADWQAATDGAEIRDARRRSADLSRSGRAGSVVLSDRQSTSPVPAAAAPAAAAASGRVTDFDFADFTAPCSGEEEGVEMKTPNGTARDSAV
eukprot:TRINITY_DN12406_c0_g1_i1.p1 TRINITY_DN12406_c0_g1~~TRINITY_DN12406_c0_g1_i1.p1  ORF type:complete len:922 (+),score=168.47 TRINITY_DN12406_c0_g1_i1:58-2823(+)